MSTRRPLFPIDLSSRVARALAEKDPEFHRALRDRGSFVIEVSVSATLTEDKVVTLNAWCSTDDGFCQTAGSFWKSTSTFTDEQFNAAIACEIMARAEQEIDEEDEEKKRKRIGNRAALLSNQLLNKV